MTRGIISGHPRVVIERRPEWPVVVHDRNGFEKEMRRGRMAAAGVGFAGVAVLGFMLASIWQTGGLNWTHIRNAALVATVLLARQLGFSVLWGLSPGFKFGL